jgi:hypothetical protein
MKQMFANMPWRTVTAAFALSLASMGALYATPVTISGGFTGYNGYVGGYNPSLVTYFNGQNVTASSGCDATSSAPYSATFASTQSISFTSTLNGTSLGDNLVQFTPSSPQDVGGLFQQFLLGTITYTNGNWYGSTADFALSLTTSSSDPLLNGSVFNGTLHLTITPNDLLHNTPQQNADCLSFTGFSNIQPFCVYESVDSPTGTNTGSVQLYGMIDALVPTQFSNATGGGFVGSGATTPEPMSVFLTGAGLALFAFARRRARR